MPSNCTYFIMNIIVTLIWWIIPCISYLYRRRYKLPPKIVIWPVTPKMIAICDDTPHDVSAFIGSAIFIALAGVLSGVPALLILGAYRLVYPLIKWLIGVKCIKYIKLVTLFSKEERIQIALGTLSEKGE